MLQVAAPTTTPAVKVTTASQAADLGWQHALGVVVLGADFLVAGLTESVLEGTKLELCAAFLVIPCTSA